MDEVKQAVQAHYAKEIDVSGERFFSFQEMIVEQMWILVSTGSLLSSFDKSFSLSEIFRDSVLGKQTDIFALSLAYGAHISSSKPKKINKG